MPFDKQDLLRQSAYSEGDVLPLLAFGRGHSGSTSTSSTTYGNSDSAGVFTIQWDQVVPDTDDLVVAMAVRVNPGTGETVGVRVRNSPRSDTLVERTGITSSGNIFEGWDDYDPPAPGGNDIIRFQHRTDDGTNSSDILIGSILLGVQL